MIQQNKIREGCWAGTRLSKGRLYQFVIIKTICWRQPLVSFLQVKQNITNCQARISMLWFGGRYIYIFLLFPCFRCYSLYFLFASGPERNVKRNDKHGHFLLSCRYQKWCLTPTRAHSGEVSCSFEFVRSGFRQQRDLFNTNQDEHTSKQTDTK